MVAVQEGSCQYCPTHNGLYPNVQNCKCYFKCIEGVPIQKWCPPGQKFDVMSMTCSFPSKTICAGSLMHLLPGLLSNYKQEGGNGNVHLTLALPKPYNNGGGYSGNMQMPGNIMDMMRMMMMQNQQGMNQNMMSNYNQNMMMNYPQYMNMMMMIMMNKYMNQNMGNQNMNQNMGNQNMNQNMGYQNMNMNQNMGNQNMNQNMGYKNKGNMNMNQNMGNMNMNQYMGNQNMNQNMGNGNMYQYMGNGNMYQNIGNNSMDQNMNNQQNMMNQNMMQTGDEQQDCIKGCNKEIKKHVSITYQLDFMKLPIRFKLFG